MFEFVQPECTTYCLRVCEIQSLIYNGTLKIKMTKYKSLSVINKHNDLFKFCT